MIISVNWLKKFTAIDGTIDELTDLIGSRLVEIEGVTDLSAKYKDVTVAEVIECSKLEGSDHLNITKIDDGNVREGVPRDDNGYVQVVCGAPNVRQGMKVAWLPPQSTVPSSFGGEPFVLDSRKLMGVMSYGMLASASELDLFDDHSGILEVDDAAVVGESFAARYELNDYLLDIENKSLTHRPDCFGIIGFAREVAAIQGKSFTTPDWLAVLDTALEGSVSVTAPHVTISDQQLSARYQAVVLEGANADASSPLAVQTYLARVGMRPVNAVVDMTNYLMLLTGQPLHAFDYDKVRTIAGTDDVAIEVRAGHDNEPLQLLDGRTIELTPEDIVIAVNGVAIALAGAMGGASTEIDAGTKSIILESATFDMFHLRTTQMRHGIFSEAITRFTKGQSPEQTAPVLGMAVQLLRDWVGFDGRSDIAETYPSPQERPTIQVSADTINSVLGTQDSLMQMRITLENVEFNVEVEANDTLVIRPPYWRHDIAIAEDIVEEIGRINAYDDIEPTLATRDFRAVLPSSFDAMRSKIRNTLVRGGANELLTYSFVHGDLLSKAQLTPDHSYRIINSISPDLQYYRQSLQPSLLNNVYSNLRVGYDRFTLFELNKVHSKEFGMTDENVPAEMPSLAAVTIDKQTNSGAPFYTAKKYLEYLMTSLGVQLRYEAFDSEPESAMTAPFEWRRSAHIVDENNRTIGVVGEYKKSVTRAFKLPDYSSGFEIDLSALFAVYENRQSQYVPISKYPGTSRDVCFQVTNDVTYGVIVNSMSTKLAESSLLKSIEPVDIYQAQDSDVKNCTIRLNFQATDRTLESGEVNAIVASAAEKTAQEISATIV